jgi:hypothetical protein
MAAPWVSLDVIPEPARPEAVVAALSEAIELRDRLRAAQEERAQSQSALERLEADDVAKAAERIRSGSAPGAIPQAIQKAKGAVELSTRNARALNVASADAAADLAKALTANADTWLKALDDETHHARERAIAALAELDESLGALGALVSAAAGVEGARDDGRWDRPVRQMVGGSIAPSSKRLTANGEALTREQVLAFVGELVEPPSQQTTPTLTAA